MNWCQHQKDQSNFSFHFKDIVDLNILEFDWPRRFQPISQEPNISQTWDLYSNIVNDLKLDHRLNSEKNNVFSIVHKALFLAHFWGSFFFLQKYRLRFEQLHLILAQIRWNSQIIQRRDKIAK